MWTPPVSSEEVEIREEKLWARGQEAQIGNWFWHILSCVTLDKSLPLFRF